MNDLLEKAADHPNTSLTMDTIAGAPGKKFAQISVIEKALYLALFTALVAVRIPSILKGRMWAEEGTVFFVNA